MFKNELMMICVRFVWVLSVFRLMLRKIFVVLDVMFFVEKVELDISVV